MKQAQKVMPPTSDTFRQHQQLSPKDDDVVVNTQEQQEPVNPQDAEPSDDNRQESEQKEKGYREGTRNDTDKQTQNNNDQVL